MEQEACCTCATLLSAVPRSRFPFPPIAEQAEKAPLFDPDHPEETEKPPLPNPNHDEKTEKPSLRKHQDDRRLPCCSRVICHACLVQNHRYHSYCPYCQVSSSSDPPPSYPHHDPPPYSPLPQQQPATDVSMAPSDPEKAGGGGGGLLDVGGEVEDTLHFLDHANDSVASLSLRYGVPVGVLRRTNNLPSDHLLAARRTLLIPATHYRAGVSLSPRPVEGEAEEARKAKIRRFMVACKASEYDVAVFYLEQAGYDFSAAVETFFADEAWEREHPLAEGGARRSRERGKGTGGGGGGWFARKPK